MKSQNTVDLRALFVCLFVRMFTGCSYAVKAWYHSDFHSSWFTREYLSRDYLWKPYLEMVCVNISHWIFSECSSYFLFINITSTYLNLKAFSNDMLLFAASFRIHIVCDICDLFPDKLLYWPLFLHYYLCYLYSSTSILVVLVVLGRRLILGF